MISCYANEIEMKSFKAKKNEKKERQKGEDQTGLIQDENKTKFSLVK